MIAGVIQAAEGRVRLKVKGRRGREQEIEAVIDTGYTASLTLPPAVIQALGLRWQTVERFKLADGSICFSTFTTRQSCGTASSVISWSMKQTPFRWLG
jgi:predicted aspartyl protease